MTVQLEKDWTSLTCLKGLPWQSFFCLKKDMTAWPRFTELHKKKTTRLVEQFPSYRGDQLGEVFPTCTAEMLVNPNTACQHKNLILNISTVVEEWWFGLILQPQDLGTLQLTINSSVYKNILESNVWSCVWQLNSNNTMSQSKLANLNEWSNVV